MLGGTGVLDWLASQPRSTLRVEDRPGKEPALSQTKPVGMHVKECPAAANVMIAILTASALLAATTWVSTQDVPRVESDVEVVNSGWRRDPSCSGHLLGLLFGIIAEVVKMLKKQGG